jgi:uncharacterized integral membrane protein (TIGR00698 family)
MPKPSKMSLRQQVTEEGELVMLLERLNQRMDYKHKLSKGFAMGLGITLLIAGVAYGLAQLPFLSIMGQLILAILLGFAWKMTLGVPAAAEAGISFSSKKLLRYGIIMLGMRLNILDIIKAGPRVFLIAASSVLFGMIVVYFLCRAFKLDPIMSILTACGSSICGAAAVVAISPQVKADADRTAMAAAVVAILGTIFTLAYTVLYPVLHLVPQGFGVFSGATLHEIAHVIAAAEPIGKEALDMALIVKLSRVALLIPVAIVLGLWIQRAERRKLRETEGGHTSGDDQASKFQWKNLPIPWFIVGFILMSGVNTLGILPAHVTSYMIVIAYLLIAMAMAGLGLNINVAVCRRFGLRALLAGAIGSVLLSGFGYLLVLWYV